MAKTPVLVSCETSRNIDALARNEWSFNLYTLIEAAGLRCVKAIDGALTSNVTHNKKITVMAGPGNNGADALCILKNWLLDEDAIACDARVILSRAPEESSPLDLLRKALEKMRTPVFTWEKWRELPGSLSEIHNSDIIVDGIAGTGARGALRGVLREMVETLNAQTNSEYFPNENFSNDNQKPLVFCVDLPSGMNDEWEPGMPVVRADYTLSIEPQKLCLYNPALRPFAGTILPVKGVFPAELMEAHKEGSLLDWSYIKKSIPPVPAGVHKYQRGCVEIHAGSVGATGAAYIASRGAQVAGAGLVRLVVDEEIYPVLASQAAGIMVTTVKNAAGNPERFKPDVMLIGPGWGRDAKRAAQLEKALALEESGVPLVLDADGIALAKNAVFHGNAIITPHIGEFSSCTGIPVDDIYKSLYKALLKFAADKNATVILKSNVMIIASPGGRICVQDGMSPNLASAGSGDLLAGFCSAIAARMKKENRLDLYACAAAAASLFIEAGKSPQLKHRFSDPVEIAGRAAEIAGEAWLSSGGKYV